MASATDRGSKIRQRREALGLKQHQLAAAAGVHPKTVTNVENGRTENRDTLRALEDALTLAEMSHQLDEPSPLRPTVNRLQVRPDVWITYTVEAGDDVRLGDLREVERRLRRIAEESGE